MTHHFTDKEGLRWPLSLDLETAEFIENSDFSLLYDGPVSLLQPDEQFIKAMYTNLPLVYALAFAACHETAEEHGIDQHEFKKRLNGQAMLELKEAWHDELVDFFPELRTVLSPLREMYLETPKRAVQKITEAVEAEMGALTAEAETMIDAEIEKLVSTIRGRSSDQSQPSPESTTGELSHSGN